MTRQALTTMQAPAHAGRLLTPREVADLLRISRSMVRKLTTLRELPALYIGRLPRFDEADVIAYLERQRTRRDVGR